MDWLQGLLDRLNAALQPLAEALNAPVLVVGGAIFGIIAAIVGGLIAAARSRKQDTAIEELKALTQKQSELIERALAANADKLQQPADGATGAEPRETLRSALEDYVTSDDPRGQKVTELVAERRTEEAQKLAFAIAGDTAAEIERLTADARRKAAQKWKDAGAIADLNDPLNAVTAYENARALDGADTETLVWLGNIYLRLGRLSEAETAYRDAEASADKDDAQTRATVLDNLGVVARTRGDLAAAEDYHTRALRLSEALGGKQGMASQLANLGAVAQTRGDLAAAEDYLTRAFKLNEALGVKEGMAINLGNLGVVAQTRGDLAAAEDYHTRALKLNEELGGKEGMAAELGNLGVVAQTRGDLAAAEDYLTRALGLFEELGGKRGMASQLGNLGLVAWTRGDLAAAEDYLTRALGLFEELGGKEGMASLLGNLGVVAQTRGDLAAAEDYLTRALGLFEELGGKEGIANQLGNLGLVAQARGNVAAACAFWTRARALYAEMGHPNLALIEGWMKEAGCG